MLATVVFFAVLSFYGFFRGASDGKKLVDLLKFLEQADVRSEVVDQAARALWCASLVIVIVVALTLIWVAGRVWLRHTRVMQRLVAQGISAVGLPFIAIGLIVWASGWPKLPSAMGGDASKKMLDAAWARVGQLDIIGRTTDVLWIVAAVLSLLLASAICLTVGPTSDVAGVSKNQDNPEARELARRWRALDRLLYVGSAMLMAGLIEVVTLHTWAYAPFPGTNELKASSDICKTPSSLQVRLNETGLCGDLQRAAEHAGTVDDLRRLVRSIAITFGAGFSLLLASLYVPGALVLQQRQRRLFPETLPKAERDEELEKYELEPHLSRRLVNVSATMGPLVTGLIPALLEIARL